MFLHCFMKKKKNDCFLVRFVVSSTPKTHWGVFLCVFCLLSFTCCWVVTGNLGALLENTCCYTLFFLFSGAHMSGSMMFWDLYMNVFSLLMGFFGGKWAFYIMTHETYKFLI
mmetsp:Transcript_10327/g.15260  ORF Transcript_10327/g.15260 Transcript_10327/m.15260 type:complete len:112 (-) Transcript_10327:83-418(-)